MGRTIRHHQININFGPEGPPTMGQTIRHHQINININFGPEDPPTMGRTIRHHQINININFGPEGPPTKTALVYFRNSLPSSSFPWIPKSHYLSHGPGALRSYTATSLELFQVR